MPDYQAAKPPASPIGAILDLIAGIASFTPFGPAINIAISTAKIGLDVLNGDELGQVKDTLRWKSSYVQLKDQMDNDAKKAMTQEQRIQLGGAVQTNYLTASQALKSVSIFALCCLLSAVCRLLSGT